MSTSSQEKARNETSSPSAMALPPLDLPPPRIWKLSHLAAFLGVSKSYLYKKSMSSSDNPIPRIAGYGRLAFDTQSPLFQAWLRSYLSCKVTTNVKSDSDTD